jgi:hypothetical protein
MRPYPHTHPVGIYCLLAGAADAWAIEVLDGCTRTPLNPIVIAQAAAATQPPTWSIPVPHAWRVIFWHGLAWALTAVAPSGVGTVVGIDPASNRVVVHGAPVRGAP